MTDEEMVRLCADAMGVEFVARSVMDVPCIIGGSVEHNTAQIQFTSREQWNYDPLHDDAQAMALEDLLIERGVVSYEHGRLRFLPYYGGAIQSYMAESRAQRRRALAECVAKMQSK